MNFLKLSFLISFFLLLTNDYTTASQKQVALVIGNSNYTKMPLQNPANDARDVSFVLEKLNYEVVKGVNLTKQQMIEKITTFSKSIKDAKIGLFYFAGHGVQFEGQNFLIPINSNITTEHEIVSEAIPISLILHEMGNASNPLNIIILDACRNNPFNNEFHSSIQGLAKVTETDLNLVAKTKGIDNSQTRIQTVSYRSTTNGSIMTRGPKGVLIAYSTSPGSVAQDGVGENGVYTQFLLKFMQEPLPLEKVFKKVRSAVSNATNNQQIPWENSSLVGEDYFFKKALIRKDLTTNALWEIASFNQKYNYLVLTCKSGMAGKVGDEMIFETNDRKKYNSKIERVFDNKVSVLLPLNKNKINSISKIYLK